jgi:hypothetical protein
VSEQTWRPFGIDSEEEVAEYDALHEGVPKWMHSAFWDWVRAAISHRVQGSGVGYNTVTVLNVALVEPMCQRLQIPLPSVRITYYDASNGREQITKAMGALRSHSNPLQVADYLLAHNDQAKADDLADVLDRSKSAVKVGERFGLPGLVHRVPTGVQVAADEVMSRAGHAGVRLAKAWEALYGLTPEPSTAYSLAIKAVEDAAIPVVSPRNNSATLGTVLRDMEAQGDWKLPMAREHSQAAPGDVLISNMRMLWHGQHDRHGGQPSAVGNVSVEEAAVAVGLAVTLVSWFDAGLVARATP